jgi:adenine deaminase
MNDIVTNLGANIVDVVNGRIHPGIVRVENGRIAAIDPADGPFDTYILPGFVDAHVHIESSMLPPSEFARLSVVHGTVATVSDPHEIANVLGVDGVRYMIEDGRRVPLKFHFGAPSCVPATSFETAGARIGPEETALLLDDPEILYLSEMMNYPGVVAADPEVMAKIAAAHERGKPVDGHAPGLRGEALRAYVGAGISTDHECYDRDEALEKLSLGMKILIREGSAARNFDALIDLVPSYPDRCMFCSDDKHPDDLVEGHIDLLVRRAIDRGIDPMDALRCASANPVLHYGLNVGLLRPGDPADFIEVDDLRSLNVLRTVIDGRVVAERGETAIPRMEVHGVNKFATREKQPGDFRLLHSGGPVNVIEAIDGQLVTRRRVADPKMVDGEAVSDPERDILKIAVVNRYDDLPPAVAFIGNVGLKRGAIASSVAHDSHNVIAVGCSDAELCRAVNLVIASRGGLAVVGDGREEILPLPVAGLMSDRDGREVAAMYTALVRSAVALGATLRSPFMTLSFMALLVIPSLKLSDLGLFDGENFRFIPLAAADES